MLLKPSEIRFSQETVNNYFKEGSNHGNKKIGETLDDICEGRCKISDIPMISVKMIRNHWTTADNRRLWVFRELERLGKCTEIEVRKTGYIDPRKLNSSSGGETVKVRRSGPGGVWYLKQPEQSHNINSMDEQLQTQTNRTENYYMPSSKLDMNECPNPFNQSNRVVTMFSGNSNPYSIPSIERLLDSECNIDENTDSLTSIGEEKYTTPEPKGQNKVKERTFDSSFSFLAIDKESCSRQTISRKVVGVNEAVETFSKTGFREKKGYSFSKPTGYEERLSCRSSDNIGCLQTQDTWSEQIDTSRKSVNSLWNKNQPAQTSMDADFLRRKVDEDSALIDRKRRSSASTTRRNREVIQSQTFLDIPSDSMKQSLQTESSVEQSTRSLSTMSFRDQNATTASKVVDKNDTSACDDEGTLMLTSKTKESVSIRRPVCKHSFMGEFLKPSPKFVTEKMKAARDASVDSTDNQSPDQIHSKKRKSNLPYLAFVVQDQSDPSLQEHTFPPKDVEKKSALTIRRHNEDKEDVNSSGSKSQEKVYYGKYLKLSSATSFILEQPKFLSTVNGLKKDENLASELNNKNKQATAQPIISGAIKERLQVAAIDFGTTYSGYAFSFRNDFLEDPLKIVTNQWTTGSNQSVSLKTSTCILFKPSGEFHSFGFDAEDMYADLAAEENHRKWFFFKRFKMLLYGNQALSRRMMLKDENGNEMPAMKVFSESIKFLKHHFLDSCTDRQYGLEEDEIHWVLTVPAIWDDTAKLFMREAAIEAGIDSDHLSLALEPEAASLYCKHLPVNIIQGAKGAGITCFGPGTRYMVLDAGGGTVDITVHETQIDHTVKELYKANGGPWGGTKVDEAFIKFLTDVSSPESLDQFKTAHMEDYLDMMREFEIKKTMTSPDMDQRITIKIPVSFHEAYARIHGDELRASRRVQAPLKLQISFTGDKLRVQPDVIQGFFGEVCQKIMDHLRDIFNKREVRSTDTILMVGGFSESKMLQNAVKQNFPDKTIIIPAEAGLAVLKGAVIFGHNPRVITTRVSRYTYGLGMYIPFQVGVHPIEKKYEGEDGTYCRDAFDVHVKVGDHVEDGTIFNTHSYYPIWSLQTSMELEAYTSDQTNPSFIDEPGCEPLGCCIKVDLPNVKSKKDKEVTVYMKYGGTELHVEATVVKNQDKANARFYFRD